jgi:hypothetical protein
MSNSVLKFPKQTVREFLRDNTYAICMAAQRNSTVILRGNDGSEPLSFNLGHWPDDIEKELREYLIVRAGEILELPDGKTMMRDAVPCPGATRWNAAPEPAPKPTPAPKPQPASSDPAEPEQAPWDKEEIKKMLGAQPEGKTGGGSSESKAGSTAGAQGRAGGGGRGATVVMKRASDIQPERIQWLWQNRFALGKFSLIAGNPGLGKSQLTVHMAAQVTTGDRWPNGEGAAPLGSVVILSCEDDPADTLVPRLIAAGADPSRVHVVEAVKVPAGEGAHERQFDLANDVHALCRAVDEIGDVRLIIIDPITAYLGAGKNVDSHKNAEVRAALAPLQVHAAKHGFAAVGVSHLNKGGGTEALMRVLGSLGFVAAARVAFLVVADTANERTLFIPMKNNIGMKQPGLAFRVVSKTIADGIETSCIEWDADEVTTSADEALAAAAGRDGEKPTDKSSLSEAMNFLRDVLADGPLAAKAVEHQAKEAGITRATLRRAKGKLGVTARHRGDGGTGGRGEWVWEIPEQITFKRTDAYDNG